MNKLALCFMLFSSVHLYVLGQELPVHILTLDGKIIKTDEFHIDPVDSSIVYFNKNGDIRKLDPEFVFSIKNAAGEEVIYYKPDSLEMTYSVNEMRSFISGEVYARENYKGRWGYLSGFVIGSGTVLSMGYAGINYFYAPVLSLGYVGATGYFPLRTDSKNIPENYLENAPFKDGYKRAAVKKRFRNNAIGAAIGVVSGIILFNQLNK